MTGKDKNQKDKKPAKKTSKALRSKNPFLSLVVNRKRPMKKSRAHSANPLCFEFVSHADA